jgi:hypothetical protein
VHTHSRARALAHIMYIYTNTIGHCLTNVTLFWFAAVSDELVNGYVS